MGEERGREKGEHRERERKGKESRRERKDGAELWYVVPSLHLKLSFSTEVGCLRLCSA